MGQMNYSSRFCPGYSKMVAPLKALMGKHGDHKWTEECTHALNGLLEMACLRLKLGVADWGQPFELEVDLDQDSIAGGVVLSQGNGK